MKEELLKRFTPMDLNRSNKEIKAKRKIDRHEYLETPAGEVKKYLQLWKSERAGRVLQRAEKVAIEQKILADLKAKYGKCENCPRTEDLTLDHIIPQRFLSDFGYEVTHFILEGNYKLLCRRCNVYKADRIEFADPRVKPLLMKLVEAL